VVSAAKQLSTIEAYDLTDLINEGNFRFVKSSAKVFG